MISATAAVAAPKSESRNLKPEFKSNEAGCQTLAEALYLDNFRKKLALTLQGQMPCQPPPAHRKALRRPFRTGRNWRTDNFVISPGKFLIETK
jgi:hypothetical protein